ncbi:MAG TPA: dihydrofolate reductase family protein [Smithella sp.]|nr:dihydrofolate reductase family protein [Smithella sp.]
MRKLIMWNLITLDGFFEGAKKWDLDWHQEVLDDEFERISIGQLRSADMLVFGGTTYEGMAAYWRTAKGEVAELMNSLHKIAISTTLKTVDWENTTLINTGAVAAVLKLKQLGDGNMFLFGSGNLSETFISENIFDEYRLLIVPVILGIGNPLFGHGLKYRKFSLLESRQLGSGGVILRYAPK